MRVLDDNCVPFTETFAYDAAGRMVKEGGKTYKYGYLDKVLSVTEGSDKYTYDYHVDGQLATATYGGTTEDFLWDGLALVKRGKRGFVNEPHIGGGNPVMSSDGTTYFNDMLGTTLSATRNGETTASSLSAFGATSTQNSHLPTQNSQLTTPSSDTFFTGKPFVPGLGHAFLMRNYRSDLGKWQTADPLGYPDGWNQLAYCGNRTTSSVDLWGGYCEGGCGHLWHEFLDPAFYTKPYSDEIIKDFPTEEELEKRLERLEALDALPDMHFSKLTKENIFDFGWAFDSQTQDQCFNGYERHAERYQFFERVSISTYAVFSTNSFLDSIGNVATVAGAVAIVATLFPKITIPATYLGNGATVAGFSAWLAKRLAGQNEQRVLLIEKTETRYSDRWRDNFWHRKIRIEE